MRRILASAAKIGWPVKTYTPAQKTAAPRPQMGPARPTRASCRGSVNPCFSRISAPRPGMNKARCAISVAQERGHVAHFVNIDRQHKSEREPAAEDGPVHPKRQEHRQERARLGQSQQEELRLAQQQDGRELELPDGKRHRAEDSRNRSTGPA